MTIPFYHQKKSIERYNAVKSTNILCWFNILYMPLDPDSANPDPDGPWIRIRNTACKYFQVAKLSVEYSGATQFWPGSSSYCHCDGSSSLSYHLIWKPGVTYLYFDLTSVISDKLTFSWNWINILISEFECAVF